MPKEDGESGLVDFWRCMPLEGPPFVHPCDREALVQYAALSLSDVPTGFGAFVESRRFHPAHDSQLHLGLLPVPYIGDIAGADVVLLLLNPGFNLADYWAEEHGPGFRERHIDNLLQVRRDAEFPFHFLDPRFCWHPGYAWWERRLRPVVLQMAKLRDKGYLDALQEVSRRVAAIELIPYHSKSFSNRALAKALPSTEAAVNYVRNVLLPQAKKGGRKTVIVMRQAERWGIADSAVDHVGHVIVMDTRHARGLPLGSEHPAGRAILARLAHRLAPHH